MEVMGQRAEVPIISNHNRTLTMEVIKTRIVGTTIREMTLTATSSKGATIKGTTIWNTSNKITTRPGLKSTSRNHNHILILTPDCHPKTLLLIRGCRHKIKPLPNSSRREIIMIKRIPVKKRKSRNTILLLLSCADKDAEGSSILTVSINMKKYAKKSSKTKDLNLMFKNKESSPKNKRNS